MIKEAYKLSKHFADEFKNYLSFVYFSVNLQ